MAHEVLVDKLIYGKKYRVISRYSKSNNLYNSSFVGRFVIPEYYEFMNSTTGEIYNVSVKTSLFQNSSGVVPPDEIIIGNEYEVLRNFDEYGNDANFTGIFKPDSYWFDNVIDDSEGEIGRALKESDTRRDPSQPVPAKISDYNFFESGDTIVHNQIYRGLADTLPENVVGRIKKAVHHYKLKGPQRFPSRSKRPRLNNNFGGGTRRRAK